MNDIAYSFGDSSVFIHDLKNNNAVTITDDMMNYTPILDAIKTSDSNAVRELLNENKVITNVSNGRVEIRGSKAYLDGNVLESAEAQKLIDLVTEGATNIDRWFRFIEKLHDNPSYHCREQAYNFIAHSGMPLTETGNIIGYKGVADNYRDKHSGKFDNSVGQVLSMPRKNVDDNPNNGCSAGFHVGSFEYADNWASSDGRLMTVEYSPRDIVSVPDEQGHAKLRVCEYKVIAENTTRTKFNNGSYGTNNLHVDSGELFDWLDERCHYEAVQFEDIRKVFPRVSMSDVRDAIQEHSEWHADFGFDADTNDFTIRFMSLPS